MKYVYIEAKDNKTPEYHFLDAFMRHHKIENVALVPIGGWTNLKNLSTKMQQNLLEGDRVAILFDADTSTNGGGFAVRLEVIEKVLTDMQIPKTDIFLWPDNTEDGDFEVMLENIVCIENHKVFFDCFQDYENCVSKEYNTPNRKGKFHTFITAQKNLNKKQRDRIGFGDWLFDDSNLWNLDSDYMWSLKEFLEK